MGYNLQKYWITMLYTWNQYNIVNQVYLNKKEKTHLCSFVGVYVSLPGESHGQRSLVGCSPWGCKELGMTERLPLTLIWDYLCFPGGSLVKNLPANAGDIGLIPVSGRSPGEGNDNPLQYSCLGNPMDRGAWRAVVHGVAKESDTT